MKQPYGEAMLGLATKTKADRIAKERAMTEQGYRYALEEINKLASAEQVKVKFDVLLRVMRDACDETHHKFCKSLFIEKLVADRFFLYTDKTDSVIGVSMVTWDPALVRVADNLDKPDFKRSTEAGLS
jgi:hypothetical protein